ncbi:acetyl-CoA synthetase [Deinococcus metalli]|uniref:acetate--CoA ligase n=1 Tax=Deinococcus metalli TaxID=1141878 RepID=A0A7W8NTB0_9DEIO|nr:acetate--CoA ligase [Deinococcus metalli]MBB5378918.1 acetyl-CoA synthetase [Deinococcus metalli]GHF62744.1 acetyl-CoA synthase [Deinococcus metalli]
MDERAIFDGHPLVEPTEALRRVAPVTPEVAGQLRAADPRAYWEGVADELTWFMRWESVLEGGFGDFRYFPGGTTNVSVNCVDRHLDAHGDRAALHYEREDGARDTWTYRQLYAEMNRVAAALHGLGVVPGDRVTLYSSNVPEAFAAVQACYRLGLVYSVSFAGFSAAAVRDRLLDSRPRVVFVTDGSVRRGKVVPLKATLDEALEGVDSVERVVVIPRLGLDVPMTPGRDVLYADFTAGMPAEFPPTPLEANAPGFIIYTSGTTSRPKGLVHSGIGFLVGAYANTKWALNIRPDDVYWCTADIGWLVMPIFGAVGGLAQAATLVVYEGAPDYPSPAHFYDVLGRYGVNKLFTAPTLLRMLRRAGDDVIAHTERLELVSLVGEPLDPDTFHWTRDVLGGGHAFVNNTYGQTETGSAWASCMVGVTPTKAGSCGHALPGYVPEVVDEDGAPVPAGTLGYLTLTQPFPCLARTIWGDHERYLDTYFRRFPGRYFTADAAAIDPDSQVWVTSRVDDVINVSGHRIGTMELESALITHPAVSEAAVIGVPDEVRGAVPLAFVILRAGHTPSAELEGNLAAQIEAGVGAYARPQRVVITPTLPRTRSGKIMRRLLRDLVAQGTVTGDLTSLDNPDALEQVQRELGRV